MPTSLRRVATALVFSLLLGSAAQAQRPQMDNTGGEKPWPKVGFVEFFDGTKIPTLGRTNGENGDIITDMRGAGDGSGRIFFAERLGKVLILKDGKLLPDPFLDITPQRTTQERGLLSIAFPPDYKHKGHFYVYRTDYDTGDVIIERYKVDPANPDHALADSAETILRVNHRTQPNHNGGQLQFGPDGMLYFGIGDGGSGYDPPLNGQNIKVLLGKILRIDVESKPDEGKAYHVPSDNPFVKMPGAAPEIWAFGVRNPWRFSFDSVTGDMYIGNVGQDHWEQIYFQPAKDKGGENYGWSIVEGTHPILNHPQNTNQAIGPNPKITYPVAEFSHDIPPLFTSITGGYVYRGKEFPMWQGIYFFSDWGNGHGTVLGQIWALRRDADGNWQTHQVDGNLSPLRKCHSFGTDDDGNLYAMSFADGKIYKLVALPDQK
jgi:glucose/arabinose dehydrogenase